MTISHDSDASQPTPCIERRSLLLSALAVGATCLAPAVSTAATGNTTSVFGKAKVRPSRSGWVAAVDGQRLRYDSYGSGAVALVFVHGWMCDRSYWNQQIASFATTFQVVTLDLVGHGESDRQRSDWGIAQLGDDVAQVIASVAPGKPVVLVGHSMGGSVILAAGQKLRPANTLAGLVSVDSLFTTDRPPRQPSLWTEENFTTFTEKYVREFMFLPTSDPRVTERVAKAMSAGKPSIGIGLGYGLMEVDLAADLAALAATPLSLLNGARLPVNTASIRAAHPGARILIVKNVGHFIMLDDPQTFNALLSSELVLISGKVSEI